MTTSGYSKTPLAKKLGMKQGFTLKLINAPENYFDLITDIPDDVRMSTTPKTKKDFIHFFTKDLAELNKILPDLKKEINANGTIWISWSKKSSGVKTDVSENLIRDIGLKIGLVDIKVCAVDET
jgi:hypothetical protein